jgi:hypothetical protein
VLRQHVVQLRGEDSEEVVKLDLQSKGAQLPEAAIVDGDLINVDVAQVDRNLHVVNEGGELERSVNKCHAGGQLSCALSGFHPKLQNDRCQAAHELLALLNREVVEGKDFKMYVNWEVGAVVRLDSRKECIECGSSEAHRGFIWDHG